MFEDTSRSVCTPSPRQPSATEKFLAATQTLPIIAPRSTAAGMASYEDAGTTANLYFGTGLATTKALSRGLPFDFLGMVIGAELTRRQFGIQTIIHEISDTHAVGNGFADRQKIADLASQQRSLVNKMARILGLPYQCVLASERQSCSVYQNTLALVKKLRPEANHYFQEQWAGMNWLNAEHGVRIKVGWLTDDKPGEARGFDERRFDMGYDELAFAKLNYVYLKCGRNFDSSRSRVSPYTSVEGEDRIMLMSGEDAWPYFERARRTPSKDTRITITHLANVVTIFESLFGKIPGTSEIMVNGQENLAKNLIFPAPQTANTTIDLAALSGKINAILADVFELRPRDPGVRFVPTPPRTTAQPA